MNRNYSSCMKNRIHHMKMKIIKIRIIVFFLPETMQAQKIMK